jgi:hypothetical protein
MAERLPRRATQDDVVAITRLVVSAFGKYVERIGKPPAPMTADYAALVGTSRVWVLEEERQIVGVLVTLAEADHLLLDVIAVSPGVQEIRLCTNEAMTENLSFYPRRGFHETSRGIEDGYHRVFFSKRLEPVPTSPA